MALAAEQLVRSPQPQARVNSAGNRSVLEARTFFCPSQFALFRVCCPVQLFRREGRDTSLELCEACVNGKNVARNVLCSGGSMLPLLNRCSHLHGLWGHERSGQILPINLPPWRVHLHLGPREVNVAKPRKFLGCGGIRGGGIVVEGGLRMFHAAASNVLPVHVSVRAIAGIVN
jgi:hypothetical protein